MAKIIYVDGPDNAGKTTLIRDIAEISDRYEVINFPKRTVDGRFDIKSRNEVACFETMLNHLDSSKIYLLDRGYISNWVYGKLRQEHWKTLGQYDEDFKRLFENHDLAVVALTRNKIDCDFEDDLINLSKEGFNEVIDMFERTYSYYGYEQHQILNHDSKNNLTGVNACERNSIITSIIKWAK